jgi:hypothetical protein
MRRNLAWVAILLVTAALAVPAAAAPAPGTGGIHGRIIDSTSSLPFAVGSGGGTLSVDVISLDTMARTVQWITDPDGEYEFEALAPGQYKLRVRYWDEAGNLTRYRWNGDKANFEVADEIDVIADASIAINATLKPMRGAPVSGHLVERGTGTPLTTACYSVHLFEASGIDLGYIFGTDAFGAWATQGTAPAGRWTALAIYTPGTFDWDGDGIYETDCGASPAHLDTWYGGASGYPLDHSNLVADEHTFHTADTFAVVAGVPVVSIDIEMLRAPTCRGKVPTIFGTTLADTITGTPARDIISGLGGNDTLYGMGGNDLLCGDAGNDTLTGGNGLKDTAVGGAGASDACDAETMIGCEITP